MEYLHKDMVEIDGVQYVPVTDFDNDRQLVERDEIVRALLRMVGEDPQRGGLLETPNRVVKAWQAWTCGYRMQPADILKVFEDGAENCDEMVVRKDIPIYSHCEHHLAPIIGRCTIAYIPNGKIVGLSKMDRLADVFARRLQVQERMTNQIADAMYEHLQPKGVGVWISARHMCVESRGVRNSNSETVTSALRGVFKSEAATRAEFLSLVQGR
jgi:GTP cyclohydrolase I